MNIQSSFIVFICSYGSFFGPSQPVIARRVLEESKSILETQHIHARTPNSNTGVCNANLYFTCICRPQIDGTRLR